MLYQVTVGSGSSRKEYRPVSIDPRKVDWSDQKPRGMSHEEWSQVKFSKLAFNVARLAGRACSIRFIRDGVFEPKQAPKPAPAPAPKPAPVHRGTPAAAMSQAAQPAQPKAENPRPKVVDEDVPVTFAQAMGSYVKRIYRLPDIHTGYVLKNHTVIFSSLALDRYPTLASFRMALLSKGLVIRTAERRAGRDGTHYYHAEASAPRDEVYDRLLTTTRNAPKPVAPGVDATVAEAMADAQQRRAVARDRRKAAVR